LSSQGKASSSSATPWRRARAKRRSPAHSRLLCFSDCRAIARRIVARHLHQLGEKLRLARKITIDERGDMRPANITGMTAEERRIIAAWLAAGTPAQ
jgi:uncharacterized membrane protein